jgi:hypothetical protein
VTAKTERRRNTNISGSIKASRATYRQPTIIKMVLGMKAVYLALSSSHDGFS